MFNVVGDVISPGGDRGKVIILIYHRTLPAQDAILHDEVDAPAFERQVAMLAAEFNVLTLREAAEHLACRTLPARAVCVTFDDGYADNERTALPILKRYGIPATFFVSTGFSDGDLMFNDGVIEAVRSAPAGTYELSTLGLNTVELSDAASRRGAIDRFIGALKYRPVRERHARVEQLAVALRSTLPRNVMMTPLQIEKLHREGMEIGAHTVNHPILSRVGHAEARSEIVCSKRALEDITDAPVTSFAYPNGKPGVDYGERDVRIVREAGFTVAVSTVNGVADRHSDMFQLPRFAPWERRPRMLGLRMLVACARSSFGTAEQRSLQAAETQPGGEQP